MEKCIDREEIQLQLKLQLLKMCKDREEEGKIEVQVYTDAAVDYVVVEDGEILHRKEDQVCSNHDNHCMVMSTYNECHTKVE